MPQPATRPFWLFLSLQRQRLALALMAVFSAAALSLVPATVTFADDDPERRWVHIVEATGFVDAVSICTWAVCGDPDSNYRQQHNDRGIVLWDLSEMTLEQEPGPGWWYVDGEFIRDSFEKNARATAGIHKVNLSWSTGGLGMSDDGVTFGVAVSPTGQVVETTQSSLEITSLTPEVEHTFTITATLPDGSTRTAPVVSATPLVDPNPDCLPSRQATECLSATRWAHIVEATGFVDAISICTWNVCGNPESFFRQDHNSRGIILLDLDEMSLEQQPGPGWWYVGGQFIRDSFEKNATARAGIHRVDLSWSTGGLGLSTEDIVYSVSVSPTGQVIDTRDSRLEVRSLTPGVLHTFTVTATLPDGSTRNAPVVSATPLEDPNPDCLPSGQATECLSATNWAHVRISDGLIVTVAVCTEAVCGDMNSDYSRIYRERGIMLVELVNTRAWSGWTYRDGMFFPPASDEDGGENSAPGGNVSRLPTGGDSIVADEPDEALTGEGSASLATRTPQLSPRGDDSSGGSEVNSPDRSLDSSEGSARPASFDQLVIPEVVERVSTGEESKSLAPSADRPSFIVRLIAFFASIFSFGV